MNERYRLLICGVHLFALSGFAVAQPIFDLLGRYAVFFVARQATPGDIISAIAVLLFVPPLVAWLLELILNLLAPRSQRGLHLAYLVLLVALAFLPPLKHIPRLPGGAIVFLALALGGAFSAAYFLSARMRSLISVLALAPVLFAVFFAFGTPILGLLNQGQGTRERGGAVHAAVPVVMVIFDGLSTVSLLDEQRRVDALRYPAFAALAGGSTWFRNTTTVHDRTDAAVPAILTGRYPTRKAPPPIVTNYPENFFTLLEGSYRMNVHEPVTRLYFDKGGRSMPGRDGLVDRARDLYLDLAVIYLHAVLPRDLALDLPPLEEKWGDFAGASRAGEEKGRRNRKAQFHAFLESIEPCESRCLHFLHTLLPHPPWQYLPSGKRYFPETVFGAKSSRWGAEEWWVVQGYQRHLLQVAFADKLLGELIARLKSLGMYDRSLIVVTADHGRSFWPGESQRNIRGAKYPEEILGVPLLVKAPYQRTGKVSDRNVETVDILPTMADMLGIKIGWPVDGCSAVAAGCPERAAKIAVPGRSKRIAFSADVLGRGESLKRKLALFGSGKRPNGLFAIGGYPGLVGRRVAEFAVKGEAASMSLSRAPASGSAAADEYVPARVAAVLHPSEELKDAPQIAVSANGVIQAVAPALPDGRSRLVLSAMLPEEALRTNHNEFQFFLVRGPPQGPELYPIPVR